MISSTRRRKYRSRRKRPSETSRSRSRLVAAMTRTSTLTASVPPTRSNGWPSSTRRNLAWMAGLISPISSSIKRAFVRGLELADLALRGAGERALLVSEEFAGQQAPGQGRAIQTNEGAFAAWTGEVYGARHEFLAHAAFAADQHGGAAGGGAADFVGDAGHQRAGADDFALHAQSLAQLQVFVAYLIEVFGQFLVPSEIVQRHGHGVGHGQGVFQVVGVGHAIVAGRIEVQQAHDARAAANRRQITLVASTTPWLSRLPSELSPITLRAKTASPSRSTVEASTLETRW